MPVDPGSFHVMHGQLGGIQAQAGGQRAAQREHALAVCPHADLPAVPAGDRAAGGHRAVRDERPGELGGQGLADLRRRLRVLAPHDRLVLGGLGQQETFQVVLVRQRLPHRPPGRPGQLLAAVTAARSVSAITPRNEPSRTCATTPAGRSASPTPSRVAAGAGGRITRPNSMPGSIWSCRKRGRPVALSGRSIRGALRPATRHWAGGLAAAVSCAARSRRVASSSDQ